MVPGQQRSSTYSRAQLADIARQYYLEDRTKLDIARESGLSRFAVARMLDRARALGIVTITVEAPDGSGLTAQVPTPRARAATPPATVDEALSARLADRLGLDEAVVVRVSGSGGGVPRAVGLAAARWVRDCVRAGDVVACAPADGSRSAAQAAAAAWSPPPGVTVTALPLHGQGEVDRPAGEACRLGAPASGDEDPWEAITVALVDPVIAVGTDELRSVPHVVVVATGIAAARSLIESAVAGPATVMVVDTSAAQAVLDHSPDARTP